MTVFQNGAIFWSLPSGAREMHGAMLSHYRDFGGPASLLGFPLTDETATPDGVGRFNHFAGGSIYWTPGLGAHEVHGSIRAAWAAAGWERGPLGYPTSDEVVDGVFRRNTFVHGTATYDTRNGSVTIALQ